jgi:hypothetical protein
MILNSPYITGSLTVTGNITASGGITISGSIDSASYAANADRVDGLDSTSFVFTSSYVVDSGSMSSRVTTIESKYASTGSNIFQANQTICGNLTTTGTITAQTINVQQVTSSVVYSCGSNIFGCAITDTQQFTGSVFITGSNFRVTATNNCFSGQVCSNTLATTGNATIGGTITGTTIYGSTAICGAVICGGATTLTGALSGTSATFSGDLTVDTNTLYVDSANNKVGIGTTSLFAELQVAKSSDVTIAMSNSSSVTSGNRGTLTWYNSAVSTVAIIRAAAVTDNVGTELQFYTRPAAGSLTQVLTLASTGAATFSSSVTAGGIIATSGTGLNSSVRINNTTATTGVDWHLYSLNNGNFGLYNNTAGAYAYQVTSGGSVGIGTPSVTNKLIVVGSETGTQITTPPIGKFVNTGNTFSKFIIGSDNANYDAVMSMDNNATLANTKLRIYIGNGTNSTAGHSNDQIVLQGNGNVGIGTSSPSTFMHVVGADTSARGQISAQGTSGNEGRITIWNNTSYVGEFGSSGSDISLYTAGAIKFNAGSTERMRITNGGIACFACQVCTPFLWQKQNGGNIISIAKSVDVGAGTSGYMTIDLADYMSTTYNLYLEMSAGAYGNSNDGPGVFKVVFGGFYSTAAAGACVVVANTMTNGSWEWNRSGTIYCIKATNTGSQGKFIMGRFDIAFKPA